MTTEMLWKRIRGLAVSWCRLSMPIVIVLPSLMVWRGCISVMVVPAIVYVACVSVMAWSWSGVRECSDMGSKQSLTI
jgi:hypothetical protein